MDFSESATSAPGAKRTRWWKLDDPGQAITNEAKTLDRDQAWKRVERLIWARLYAEQDITSLHQVGASVNIGGDGAFGISGQRFCFNAVAQAINSAWSRITRNRPRVRFLTRDGDYELQRNAQLMTMLMDGLFLHTGAWYREAPLMARDAMIFGTGAIKSFEIGKTIGCERTLIDEILYDPGEALRGVPRTLYQKWYAQRDDLRERYAGRTAGKDKGEKVDKVIEAAQGYRPGDDMATIDSDVVCAYEAWHVGHDKVPGRHALALDGVTLADEEYPYSRVPFVFMHWEDPIVGMWGRGIAEHSAGLQAEIQKDMRTIQTWHERLSIGRVFVDGEITKKLTNQIGAVYNVTPGTRIMSDPGVDVSPGIYQHVNENIRRVLEQNGVNQMAATGQKPAGINSGTAIREYNDTANEPLLRPAERYERAFVDMATFWIEMATHMATRERGRVDIQVAAPNGNNHMKMITWSSIDLDRDAYIIQAWPSSIMPLQPWARQEWIEERIKSGFLSQEEGMMLADFPDTEAVSSVHTAGMRAVTAVVSNIIEHGKYESPEPGMNLDFALKYVQQSAVKARLDGVSDDRIDLLYRFADACQRLIQALAPKPAPAPAPMPGAVGGGALPPDMGAAPGLAQIPVTPT
jgi:hypothetical protein